MSRYLQAIQRLSRPTDEQIDRFARHVATMHSWYKHLPIRGKVPFLFFIDPDAGKCLLKTNGGEATFVEVGVERESCPVHYSTRTTQDYRRNFGYWRCLIPNDWSCLFAAENDGVDTRGAGLSILADTGDWEPVPADLWARGIALVNSLIHPQPYLGLRQVDPTRRGKDDFTEAELCEVPTSVPWILGQHWLLLHRKAMEQTPRLEDLVPAPLLNAVQALINEKAKPYFARMLGTVSYDPASTTLWQELGQLGLATEAKWAVIKKAEEAGLCWFLELRAGGHDSLSIRQLELVAQLAGTMVTERHRQLNDMIHAMQRFVEAAYT